MSKRINIVLPETTVRTIDRMVGPSERRRFKPQCAIATWTGKSRKTGY